MMSDDPSDSREEMIKEIVKTICADIGERGEFSAFHDIFCNLFEHVDENLHNYLPENEFNEEYL